MLATLVVGNQSAEAQSSSLFGDEALQPQLQAPIQSQPVTAPSRAAASASAAIPPVVAPTAPRTVMAVPPASAALQRQPSTLAPSIAEGSFHAVSLPEPTAYRLHDLVTIIVRESSNTKFDASLGTTKEVTVEGEIAEFPRLQLSDLLNLQVKPSNLTGVEPKVDVELEHEFDGQGTKQRRDEMTFRITAEIIDIKPNGNLVLSAHKQIQDDEEVVEMTLTGVCRPDDITAANDVLSTQLHNLTLLKKHKGELRKATKKGFLTDVFEFIFNI